MENPGAMGEQLQEKLSWVAMAIDTGLVERR